MKIKDFLYYRAVNGGNSGGGGGGGGDNIDNTTWQMNENPTLNDTCVFSVKFKPTYSGANQYYGLGLFEPNSMYYHTTSSAITAYDGERGWGSAGYKTINIQHTDDQNFIAWLKQNATQIE